MTTIMAALTTASSALSASPGLLLAPAGTVSRDVGAAVSPPIALAVSPRHRRSIRELFLEVLDGLFMPEPLSGSVDRRALPAADGPFYSLDTPAYLRRGLRIPELD